MSDVQGLEKQLEDAKHLIDRRNKAIALSQVPLFKELILDEFCVKEAARLVGQSADPVLSDRERADALSMAQAAGHLRRYLQMMIQMGAASERTLPDLEEALAEARAEEDADQSGEG
jgi:hypothetical protein